jgi:hypothetical protein
MPFVEIGMNSPSSGVPRDWQDHQSGHYQEDRHRPPLPVPQATHHHTSNASATTEQQQLPRAEETGNRRHRTSALAALPPRR